MEEHGPHVRSANLCGTVNLFFNRRSRIDGSLPAPHGAWYFLVGISGWILTIVGYATDMRSSSESTDTAWAWAAAAYGIFLLFVVLSVFLFHW